jgi:hypothetical protein
METCTVETGLLKKKPCGEASVTHCANCEQPLCAKHAVPQLNDTGKKSGKFMCKDCSAAQRDIEKNMASAARKETAAKYAKAAVAPANKPAAPASPGPAAAKPKEEDSLGGIDFTPGGGGDKK